MNGLSAAWLASLAILLPVAHAQVPAGQAAPAATEWRYRTKRLEVADVDALLARPDGLVVLDARRPDELIKYGSFPAFLNIQYRDLEKHLA